MQPYRFLMTVLLTPVSFRSETLEKCHSELVMTLKTLNNTDVISNTWIVFEEGEHSMYDKGWRILVLQPLFFIIFVY